MGKNKTKLIEDLKPRNPISGLDPVDKFLDNDESMDFIMNLLIRESPRLNERILDHLSQRIHAFKTIKGNKIQNQIRFSDFLTLSYISIKYPYLIEFFKNTIHELLPPVTESLRYERIGKQLDDKKEDKKPDISGWITKATKYSFSLDEEKNIANKLVGAVSHMYFDRLAGKYDDVDKLKFDGSSSYPENLNDYLNIIPGYTSNEFTISHSILKQHSDSGRLSKDISVKDLYEYSRLLRHYARGSVQAGFNLEVAENILNFISTGKIKPDPRVVKDTDLQAIIYEFCFQLLEVVENADKGNIKLRDIIEVFKKSLRSNYLTIGAKYQILNVFANIEREPGADIHRRMDRAFDQMTAEDEKIKNVIRGVIRESEKLYFKGTTTIYEREENFFYVLYQYWSGNPLNADEIREIQEVAKRNLWEFPDAIRLYWDQFPHREGDKGIDDSLRLDFGDYKTELYMPLDNLLEATEKAKLRFKDDPEFLKKVEYWTKIRSDKNEFNKFKERRKIKEDTSTLKAVLIRRGIVNKKL